MLSFRKPQPPVIQAFIDQQRRLNLTYAPIGATAAPPAEFVQDHTRIELGSGERIFATGKTVLQNWRQFRLGWLEPASPQPPIREGEVVAMLARVMGLWWLNACRIVYVIDESQPYRRFGFAYGTLPGHAESGEERFLIEMDQTDKVWYDIFAFSRPRHFLARLGYPYVRRLQKRFGAESAARMRQALQSAQDATTT